ncbi:Uncharacterized protein dnm_048110 [Desulfonema magnum]|uniref:Uncharacterized protein n=1 Tax=Desulfonema magnum TaxID=45655 RepID=A0A975BPG2_9BACT|nr:Uncharacterized protein dnm_048110 [Desulfonema magnum]
MANGIFVFQSRVPNFQFGNISDVRKPGTLCQTASLALRIIFFSKAGQAIS